MKSKLLCAVMVASLGCGSESGDPMMPDPPDPGPDGGGPEPAGEQLAAGRRHACAIASGAVKCWGDGANGELGDGLWAQSGVPVDVVTGPVDPAKPVPAKLAGAVAVAAGYGFTCALTAGGAVRCWG